jgi:hypothetical protein
VVVKDAMGVAVDVAVASPLAKYVASVAMIRSNAASVSTVHSSLKRSVNTPAMLLTRPPTLSTLTGTWTVVLTITSLAISIVLVCMSAIPIRTMC